MKAKQIKKTALAYSYLRFSTPQQIEGDSQRRQLDGSREWCKKNGVELVEEMQELGVSAFRGKNRMIGVLGKFLDLVHSGEITPGTFLIIENIDRLSREDVLPALQLYIEIITAGITIVTLIDDQVHSEESIQANPMVLQMAIASMSRANEESRVKARRLNDKWKETRRLALEGKASPMGRLPAWLKRDKKTGEIVLLPIASVVKRIFSLYAAGDRPFTIAKILNSEGAPRLSTGKRACKYWKINSIRGVLSAKSTCGIHVVREPYDEEVVDSKGKVKEVRRYRKIGEVADYYPKAVSVELFAKVATLVEGSHLRTNKRKGGSKASDDNAFSGLIPGSRFTTSTKRMGDGSIRRYEYLRDANDVDAGIGKQSFSWNYLDFQDLFVATCRLALRANSKTTEAEEALDVVKQSIRSATEERESFLKGLGTLGVKKQGHEYLAAQIAAKSNEIGELEERGEALVRSISNAKIATEAIPVKIESRVELRRIIQANVKEIEVDFGNEESKSFRVVLYSGVSYRVTHSCNNHFYVKTDDFSIPPKALAEVKVRQKWRKLSRRPNSPAKAVA